MSIPRLVAVNVGLPQDVPWRGRTVHTGVFKHPVDGPQMVRTLNIDGDGQGDLGGHGGPHRAIFMTVRRSCAFALPSTAVPSGAARRIEMLAQRPDARDADRSH